MLDSKAILLNSIVTFLAAEAFARHPAESSGTDNVSFHGEGVSSFRDAARLIAALPYGRNSGPWDHLVALRGNKGTFSTKHSLLARLAQEQRLTIAFCIGREESRACAAAQGNYQDRNVSFVFASLTGESSA